MRAAAFSSGGRSRLSAVVVTAKESRIGSLPIVVPKGVTVDLKGNHLKVKVRRRRERASVPAPASPLLCVHPPLLYLL